jgi:signal transduction histidine kinase
LINRKDDHGKLLLQLTLDGDKIVCTVTDNGVGREEAGRIKAGKNIHYQSAAIPNIQERLETLRAETGLAVSLMIEDLTTENGPQGTKVTLVIPHQ